MEVVLNLLWKGESFYKLFLPGFLQFGGTGLAGYTRTPPPRPWSFTYPTVVGSIPTHANVVTGRRGGEDYSISLGRRFLPNRPPMPSLWGETGAAILPGVPGGPCFLQHIAWVGQPFCSFHSSPLPSVLARRAFHRVPPLDTQAPLPASFPCLHLSHCCDLGLLLKPEGRAGWLTKEALSQQPFWAPDKKESLQEVIGSQHFRTGGAAKPGNSTGADGEGGHPLSPSPLFSDHKKGPTRVSETLPRGWTSAMETCGRRPFHSEAPAERNTPQSPNWPKGGPGRQVGPGALEGSGGKSKRKGNRFPTQGPQQGGPLPTHLGQQAAEVLGQHLVRRPTQDKVEVVPLLFCTGVL